MNRYPTPLSFDSSGSAVVRFFGDRVAHVVVHMPTQACGKPMQLLACPESIGILGKRCFWCGKHKQGTNLDRIAAHGWDVEAGKWCVLLAPKGLVSDIKEKMTEMGIDEYVCLHGGGPDVIIQRRSRLPALLSLAMETIGIPRGDNKRPSLEDFLEGMESRSCWAKDATV